MKKLIVTQTSGGYDKLREIVYPNMESYASKCGADFMKMEECHNECPVMGKLAIYDLFDQYERILLLDADLIIRPDCPDLFDLVPETRFAAYDEGAACRTIPEMYNRLQSMMRLAAFFGMPAPFFDDPYFSFYNAGVILASRSHKGIFEPPPSTRNPRLASVCPEQVYINCKLLQEKPVMQRLPVCFNQMPWNWQIDYRETSYIIHYADVPMEARLQLMTHDLQHWHSP